MYDQKLTHAFLPEFKFLITATRWPHDPEAIVKIQQSSKSILDPERLMALAKRHHVVSLVARALGHCSEWADTPIRNTMRAEALSLAEEQFRQIMQTRQAVSALQAHNIPVAVLKGAPAALSIFGEVGVRSSVDIDLLIAREDLDRAHLVISETGYVRSEPPIDATNRQIEIANRYGKDWGFDHFYSDTGIELHWRLFQNPHLLPKITLADAVEKSVLPGITLPVLPDALSALYLIAHGAEHAWARLKWLVDLAAILRKTPEAADELLNLAYAHSTQHVTMAALLLSHQLYDTALPQAHHQALAKEWRTRKLLQIAQASLIGDQEGTELEDMHMGTTQKSMGHYLFSSNPRYWWREATYDLFHDAASDPENSFFSRISKRLSKVVKVQNSSAAA